MRLGGGVLFKVQHHALVGDWGFYLCPLAVTLTAIRRTSPRATACSRFSGLICRLSFHLAQGGNAVVEATTDAIPRRNLSPVCSRISPITGGQGLGSVVPCQLGCCGLSLSVAIVYFTLSRISSYQLTHPFSRIASRSHAARWLFRASPTRLLGLPSSLPIPLVESVSPGLPGTSGRGRGRER